MRAPFLERLAQGPLVGDGGYYLELERRVTGSYRSGIPAAVLGHPEGVLELHREFVRAGSELLQAMAWGVRPMDGEAELHRVAVRLAREAAGEGRYVAGTLSPMLYLGNSKWEPMTEQERTAARAFFDRRIGQQAVAGVDVFILETFYSVEECALAIPFVKGAGLPVVATLTFRDVEFTRDGHSPAEAARRLVDAGADVVGLNCMRPWPAMEPLARQMRQAVTAPLCVQPTAYELEPGETFNRPLSVANLWTRVEPRPVTRYAMADYAREARGMGIAFIGACCGALPYHIRAIAEVLGKPVGLPDADRGYQEAQAP
jgi:betaine-homocysteine S-methyltransferase